MWWKGGFVVDFNLCTHFLLLPTSLLCVFCFLISFYCELLFVFFFPFSFAFYKTSIVSVFVFFPFHSFSLSVSSYNIRCLLHLSALQNFTESKCSHRTKTAVIQSPAICHLTIMKLCHKKKLFHHMRRISGMEIMVLDKKGISPVATPPSPTSHSMESPKLHLFQYKRMPNWDFWGGKKECKLLIIKINQAMT